MARLYELTVLSLFVGRTVKPCSVRAGIFLTELAFGRNEKIVKTIIKRSVFGYRNTRVQIVSMRTVCSNRQTSRHDTKPEYKCYDCVRKTVFLRAWELSFGLNGNLKSVPGNKIVLRDSGSFEVSESFLILTSRLCRRAAILSRLVHFFYFDYSVFLPGFSSRNSIPWRYRFVRINAR